MDFLGSLSHLVTRFFDVVFAKPLSKSEKAAVVGWLSENEAKLFFEQPFFDQRHSYHAGLKVVAAGVKEISIIKAALLHDVGKRHCGLGAIGRSIATVWLALKLPAPVRFHRYGEHGELGAVELEAIGCQPVVVEFARHHPNHRPPTISPATWNLLRRADQPAKPKALVGR